MFKVIEGGLGRGKTFPRNGPAQIRDEGQRRLREAGVDSYLVREKLTGVTMPSTLRAFMLQVDFATAALSKLSPTPADICDDRYWPRYERAAPIEAALISR